MDCNQEQDARVRSQVAEITKIAYDAKDLIDKFILKVTPREDMGSYRIHKKFAR